jgi:hypothetical protein
MNTHHRFRQVHLDFHTSAQCQEVGKEFNPETFVQTLKLGHVDTINIFCKCHHGFSYYPTKVGTMHPNLKFDLLGSQLETLHRADIRCPIYMSIMWDEQSASRHPEWVCINKDGSLVGRRPLTAPPSTWTTLDISSPYADFVAAQVEELMQLYPREIDGFWFDICFPQPNYSPWGQAQMARAGVNLEDDQAVWRYARSQDLAFFDRLTKFVHGLKPDATVFYNGTTTHDMAELLPYQTHYEVESLPTSDGQWGYMHFPVIGRQARTYGREIIGMTGRFHRSWSDFGGLKTSDQLDYECGTILAAGGRICVGDQLHPRGVLDPAVYRMIGASYAKVEALEPWLYGAAPTAEMALLATGKPGAFLPGVGYPNEDVEGAAQMLLESGIQFDVVDQLAGLERYPALLLPESADLGAAWQQCLTGYLAGGGRLVLSGKAALDLASGRFLLKDVPVEYQGETPSVPSYLRPDPALAGDTGLASDYDYVFYGQACRVKPLAGAEAHGDIRRALFNRAWNHFTGHQHAPVGDSMQAPIVVQSDKVLYFSAPLFSGYRNYDYWAYRALAVGALRRFLPPGLLIPHAPGWVEFALHIQAAGPDHPARRVVHVVAFHPRRSSQPIPHVDQGWPTAGLSFKLRLDGEVPTRVYLAPGREELPFEVSDGYAKVNLPPVGVHTVVVLE